MANDKEVLVHVEHLKKYFKVHKKDTLKAVDDVSFDIYKGETLGLVGESGCGKTTCGRTVLGLYPATEGVIEYAGRDVTKLGKKDSLWFKKRAQMIFQDPYASLDPRMTVGDIIGEGLENFGLHPNDKQERISELLSLVGLNKEHAGRFPHEFSGGQRQRIGIARALAVDPEFIVCDEPISALDVSIQAQIINLLKNLQEKYNLTYLFISHDLSVVEYISDTVGVMYLGNLVEYGATEDIFRNPLHPYTKALFSAIPVPDPTVKMDRIVLEGSIPSPANPPAGCKFHTRCANCMEKCKTEVPHQREIEPGHYVVCHLYDEA